MPATYSSCSSHSGCYFCMDAVDFTSEISLEKVKARAQYMVCCCSPSKVEADILGPTFIHSTFSGSFWQLFTSCSIKLSMHTVFWHAVSGQPAEVCPFLLPCGLWGSNLGSQVWWKDLFTHCAILLTLYACFLSCDSIDSSSSSKVTLVYTPLCWKLAMWLAWPMTWSGFYPGVSHWNLCMLLIVLLALGLHCEKGIYQVRTLTNMELPKAVHSLREMQQTASYSREDSHAAQASALQSPAYPVDTQAQE